MAGMDSRVGGDSRVVCMVWPDVAYVQHSARLRDRGQIASARNPHWVLRLRVVHVGAHTVASYDRGHVLALLGHNLDLVLW